MEKKLLDVASTGAGGSSDKPKASHRKRFCGFVCDLSMTASIRRDLEGL